MLVRKTALVDNYVLVLLARVTAAVWSKWAKERRLPCRPDAICSPWEALRLDRVQFPTVIWFYFFFPLPLQPSTELITYNGFSRKWTLLSIPTHFFGSNCSFCQHVALICRPFNTFHLLLKGHVGFVHLFFWLVIRVALGLCTGRPSFFLFFPFLYNRAGCFCKAQGE